MESEGKTWFWGKSDWLSEWVRVVTQCRSAIKEQRVTDDSEQGLQGKQDIVHAMQDVGYTMQA